MTPQTPVPESGVISQHKIRSTLFERVGFAFLIAIAGGLLLYGGAARLRGTRNIRVAFVIPGVRALGANHGIVVEIVVVCGHPRNK